MAEFITYKNKGIMDASIIKRIAFDEDVSDTYDIDFFNKNDNLISTWCFECETDFEEAKNKLINYFQPVDLSLDTKEKIIK